MCVTFLNVNLNLVYKYSIYQLADLVLIQFISSRLNCASSFSLFCFRALWILFPLLKESKGLLFGVKGDSPPQ